MQKKRRSHEHSVSQLHQHKQLRVLNQQKSQEELAVTIMMGSQRSPITIHVPKPCNMKILKSMLLFHLKKILTTLEYSQIIGFQAMPTHYQTDYQLEKGIGELQADITLTCFFKETRYQADSLLSYKICKLISVGGFSKVYLLRSLLTGEFLTGKFILKQSANLELVENEYLIAKSLDHPFIVQTQQFLETEHFYVIIMEYVSGGELFELLKLHRTMAEQDARFYIVETLIAIKYLHQQSIIYRDVKPQNIMLDHQGHLKLTDFGLAKRSTERSYSFCGSIDYMAPEVLDEDGYSLQVDHYSIGNLLFELLVGSPPFYHPKFTQQQTKFHIKHTPVRFPERVNLSAAAMSLLNGLLEKEATKRLGHKGGIDEILAHEWFSSVDSDVYLKKSIQAPFKSAIRMQIPVDESQQRVQEWQSLIDKDLKKLQIKTAYQVRKNTYMTRQSLDSHNERQQQQYNQMIVQKTSNPKLKSNFSLLYVLTHKRSTSEFPRKNNYKLHITKPINHNLAAFRSLNASRKSSFYARDKRQQSREEVTGQKTVQTGLQRSGYSGLLTAGKNEQNRPCIRKKRSQVIKTFTKMSK